MVVSILLCASSLSRVIVYCELPLSDSQSDRRVRVVHCGILLYKKKIDTAGSDEGGLIKHSS